MLILFQSSAVKTEIDTPRVKQETLDDYDQSFDDYGGDDDDNPGLDPTYYTGGSYVPDEGDPFVKVTPIEKDPVLNEQYAEQLSSPPPKRRRGRPRKSDSPPPAKRGRGRPPKGVVEYSQTPRKRGRPKGSSTGPKPATAKSRKRKRISETVTGQETDSAAQTCGICGKVFQLSSLLAMHKRLQHNHRTYEHNLRRKTTSSWNKLSSQIIVRQDPETNNKTFGCSKCGEMFQMYTRCKKHNVRKHLIRYPCSKCKASFSHPLDLYHHKHRRHKSKLVLKKR